MAQLNGPYGLVIVPETSVHAAAYATAKRLMPVDADFVLGNGEELPHITLYHGKIVGLDLELATKMRDQAHAALLGQSFELGPVEVAGGNFLFWNLIPGSLQISSLAGAHQVALQMANSLDPGAKAKALGEEGLRLSEGERANCERYGHPWVGDLYRPHITLGFNKGGLPAASYEGMMERLAFRVQSVELVEVGYPGVVKAILEREQRVPREQRAINPQP